MNPSQEGGGRERNRQDLQRTLEEVWLLVPGRVSVREGVFAISELMCGSTLPQVNFAHELLQIVISIVVYSLQTKYAADCGVKWYQLLLTIILWIDVGLSLINVLRNWYLVIERTHFSKTADRMRFHSSLSLLQLGTVLASCFYKCDSICSRWMRWLFIDFWVQIAFSISFGLRGTQ